MSKIAFVTGGTGFIGSHLVESLIDWGYSEIRCLVRSKPKWLTDLDVVQINGSIDDDALILKALNGTDHVFHVGAMTRARTWPPLYDANVISTINLVRAAAHSGVSKVCVISSLAVAGHTNQLIADESMPCHPISMYGKSKLKMEQALKDIDLPIVILRPPVVYGPRDRDLLTFFAAVNRGFCVMPKNDSGLTLIYVKDLARGIIESIKSDQTTGKTYYIGSQTTTISWTELQHAIESALKKKSRMIHLPRSLIMPLGTISEYAGMIFGAYPPLNREKAREILYATKQCSSDKAFKDFGYQSSVTLHQGIEETITWYQSHGWLK
ncbi:MAG: NAD-dependent epimerase/dehydratase family protein [Bacteroidetes bacterium]|nr:NAD-dependent epimerase/dehydratase family protein [Bacteroidota bacterium]